MPSSLRAQPISYLLIHLVFGTLHLEPWLDEAIAPEMHDEIARIVAAEGQSCLRVGGGREHVHIAFCMTERARLDRLVARIKLHSMHWYKRKMSDGSDDTEFDNFCWQRGHAAFSVGPADRHALVRYIDTQTELHKLRGYQEEMRGLFAKYGTSFDERFFWK